MKPIKLTMNAFGSYADLQTIDFTALGVNGLYLITGETGSGKTTIFDAISFALFGKASGSSRANSMLRSDFADDNMNTFVELVFVSGNKEYTIKRLLKNNSQTVSLLLPDGASITGERNIKNRIEEIVGLERDQFAQIVMIAQNDFLRFLQSGTDERLKILRHIFGTEKLKFFQEQLKTRAKQENEKLNLIIHDFERYNVDVYGREKQFIEWEEQIKIDKGDLLNTDNSLAKYDKTKQEIAAKLAVAEETNKKFTDLSSFRASLEEHESVLNEIELCNKKARLGEKALRKVKPFADEAARAAENYKALINGVISAKKQEADAIIELQQAEKAINELPPLAGAQNTFAELSKKCDTAAEKLKKLNVLQKDIEVINKKQDTLSVMQTEFEAILKEFIHIENRYKILEDIFFRNQAGVLAKKLVDGIPCPVCGSEVHPNPAFFSEGDVTEAKLDKAKEARNNAQNKRDNKSLECNGVITEIKTLSDRFKNDFSEYAYGVEYEEAAQKLAELLGQTMNETNALTAEKNTAEKFLADLVSEWNLAEKKKSAAETANRSAQTLVIERSANEKEAQKLSVEAQARYDKALQDHDFTDEKDYKNALITEDELAGITKRITEYEKKGEQLTRDISRLEKETDGKEPPDLEKIKIEMENANSESSELNKKRGEVKSRFDKTETMLKELRKAAVDFEQADKLCAAVKQLSEAANGKLDFETYAQMAYFERVLHAANQRLKVMSQNRYSLLRKKEASNNRIKTGLEIEALDAYTGKARSANSLSGGESFLASLSLALGLSDVVQQSAGGIHLDAMFIDEGFGSLDTETLDIAVKTLSEMAGTDRLVGIISHVNELRERIDKQIQIEKTTKGSKIKMVV